MFKKAQALFKGSPEPRVGDWVVTTTPCNELTGGSFGRLVSYDPADPEMPWEEHRTPTPTLLW